MRKNSELPLNHRSLLSLLCFWTKICGGHEESRDVRTAEGVLAEKQQLISWGLGPLATRFMLALLCFWTRICRNVQQ